MVKLKKYLISWESTLFFLLVLEVIVFGLINPNFWKPRVLLGSINNFMPICVISLFVTLVLITGGMDIQAGSIVGLSSICAGILWQQFQVNIWMSSLVALLVGAMCGLLSGFLVAYVEVQPMVITLGGSFLYSGLAVALTALAGIESYKGINGFPGTFLKITKFNLFGIIPSQLIIFIMLTIIAALILHKTSYGRKIYLCGVNRNAAKYVGINTSKIIMSTYIFSGVSAALAGILMTSYLGTAKADFGKELTLPIITAVVLGGTSNLGGTGTIIGTALSSMVIGILRFGLSMAGMNTQYLDIPVGLLLLIVLILRFFIGKDGFSIFSIKKKRSV